MSYEGNEPALGTRKHTLTERSKKRDPCDISQSKKIHSISHFSICIFAQVPYNKKNNTFLEAPPLMKTTFFVLILCTLHASLLFGAPEESTLILDKLNSLEKTISDLSFRILALEKRLISFEEKYLFKEKPSMDFSLNTEQQSNKNRDNFEQPIGDFSFANVTYNNHYNDTIFRGDVINKSTRSYRYALFKISVFNDKGAVLSSNDFYILNLDGGTQRSFEAKLHGIKEDEFVDYAIQFNKGS